MNGSKTNTKKTNMFGTIKIELIILPVATHHNLITRPKNFPKEELYGLTSQLRRAAVSVPSNIAEGNTREHLKEYLHHISIAQASLAEIDTQLEIARRLSYIRSSNLGPVQTDLSSLGKQLYSLPNSLNKKNSV